MPELVPSVSIDGVSTAAVYEWAIENGDTDMLELLLLSLFPFLMIYAAVSDFLTMTIANWISIALVISFCILAPMAGLPVEAVGWHLATGFACLIVTFTLFSLNVIGGGDAKLLAATAVWFGPGMPLAQYAIGFGFFGLILTLGLLLTRARLAPVTGIASVDRLLEPKSGVPYGIALGASGLYAYATIPWVSGALGL